jgi:hypothetical protein
MNPATDHYEQSEPSAQVDLNDALALALAVADAPRADTVTNAHDLAGKTIGKLTDTVCAAVTTRLQQEAKAISEGRLDSVEGRLAAQAVTLDTLFHQLTQFAFGEPRTLDNFSGYLKLGLRAQAQSADALAALAEIKRGPRVVVTKQLNAAHQQIVNNDGLNPARPVRRKVAKSNQEALPEPSPHSDHAQMDTRSPREAAPAHQRVAAVDEIHRPAD